MGGGTGFSKKYKKSKKFFVMNKVLMAFERLKQVYPKSILTPWFNWRESRRLGTPQNINYPIVTIIQISYSTMQISDFKLQISGFSLQISDCTFTVSDFTFQMSDVRCQMSEVR